MSKGQFVLLLLLLLPQSLFAQVKGTIVSGADSTPVSYAMVSAFDKDGKFLSGARCDENGEFSLAFTKNVFKLSFQSIGFQEKDTLSFNGFQGDIGLIVLSTKTENLKEVVVKADMVNRNASKETVFITDSLRKGTVNALQLLGKIPGIITDLATDEIKIGKDRDVPVIVNGKDVKKDYAINLNPKRIKKIEIMRYPVGKYSDYPIVLNIELANDYTGWDVSAYTRDLYSLRNEHSNRESIGTNFTYTLPKLNIYGDFSFTHKSFYETSSYEYDGATDGVIKTGAADFKHPNENSMSNVESFSLGVDYKLASNHTVALQAWIDEKGNKQNEYYQLFKGQDVVDQLTKDNYKTDDYTLGIFYDGKFFEQLKVASELVYNRYNIREDRYFGTLDDFALTPYKGNKNYWRYYLSVNFALSNHLSFMADYTQTWKDYANYRREDGNLLYDNREVRSKVMGALSYQPLNALSLMAGTHVLTVKNEDQLTLESESHTSWMPVFKAYWKPIGWMYLMANYYCDVEYPNLDQLSTVQWQVNDILWHRGNANLKPRIMHYMEFTINLGKIIKINYMFKRSQDEIIDYYLQDSEKTYQTLANCNFRHNYLGLEGEYSLAKGLNLSFVASYQWYHRYLQEDKKHFGRTWYFDSQLQWNVPTTRLALVGSYFLRHDKYPLLQGKQYNEEEDLTLGASYSLLKGKMPVSLVVKIPSELISKKTYTKINIPNFNYQLLGDNRVNSFCVQLAIKYNLGNGKTAKMDNSKNVDVEK